MCYTPARSVGAALVATMIFACGCGPSAPKVITSADGRTQITLYGGMESTKNLNDDAILQGQQLMKELYVTVTSHPRQGYAAEITHQDFFVIVAKNTMDGIANAKRTDDTPSKINGRSAAQTVITESADDLDLVYILTTIKTETHFYAIAAWTLKSRYETNKPILEQTINSFRELK